jgi:hypothetical protein
LPLRLAKISVAVCACLAATQLSSLYCRIQIKFTPLHDHDAPDENFRSSPCLEDRDKGKILSDMSTCSAFLPMFGWCLWQQYTAKAKIKGLLTEIWYF